MRTSTSTAKLAEALAKAQGEFEEIEKDKSVKVETQKGGYTFTYADLSNIINGTKKAMAKNGLSIMSAPGLAPEGLVLTTRLSHSSGEWAEGDFPISAYGRPQDLGAQLSYFRRYATMGLLHISPEDDTDGGGDVVSTADVTRPAVTQIPHPGGAMKTCPQCNSAASVIPGKPEYGGGWVCWKGKGGCGATWDQKRDQKPAPGPATPPGLPPADKAAVESIQKHFGTPSPAAPEAAGGPGAGTYVSKDQLAHLVATAAKFSVQTSSLGRMIQSVCGTKPESTGKITKVQYQKTMSALEKALTGELVYDPNTVTFHEVPEPKDAADPAF